MTNSPKLTLRKKNCTNNSSQKTLNEPIRGRNSWRDIWIRLIREKYLLNFVPSENKSSRKLINLKGVQIVVRR